MKKTLSVIFALILAFSALTGPMASFVAAEPGVPSAAVYINGKWVSAVELSGNGTQWVTFPVSSSSIKIGTVNYVRITDNVANGDSEESQVGICMTDSDNVNTYRTPHIWLDDNYSVEQGKNADINIEGWNGTKWVCLHSNEANKNDSVSVLGKKSDGTYLGFARNISLSSDVLETYTNFRIRALLSVGSELAVNSENANLFPSANYRSCVYCEDCGGCKSKNCTLSHVPCSCNQPIIPDLDPSVAIYVNGKWVAAKSLSGVSGDAWIDFPISASVLKDSGESGGATNYVRITSNVSNGTTADTRLEMAASACDWSNTYISHNWWVDSDWTAVENVNADLAIMGWNGSEWETVHSDHDYKADISLTLGYVGGTDYLGYARNIRIESETLEKYTNFKIRVHFNAGSDLSAVGGDILNLFPEENYYDCTFCDVCGGCKSKNCKLGHDLCGATSSGHHCTFCPDCGKCNCTSEDCDCTHEKCTCGQTSEYGAAIRVRFNGKWFGLYLEDTALDGKWVSVPVEAGDISKGQICYTAVSSNVKNSAASSLKIWSTDASDGLESYTGTDRYCDDGWTLCSDKNLNIRVEGWNGEEWTDLNASAPQYAEDDRCDLGLGTDGVWSVACRNITLGDPEGVKYVRVSVQLSAEEGLLAVPDYDPDSFAAFLDPKLASDTPEDPNPPVIEHKTEPDVPEATGLTEDSKDGAKLQVRVNGETWLETALEDVAVDENGIGWATVDIPISILRSNGENQFLFTSNVNNGKAYSNNSVDVFATKVDEGASFINVNEYYDDWSLYEGYEWNALLQAKSENGEWTALGDSSSVYYDSSRLLGKTADGTGSYAAKNIVVEDLTGYSSARMQVLVHIGPNLSVKKDDPGIEHKTVPDTPSVTGLTDGNKEDAKLQVRVNGETWLETALDSVPVDENGVGWATVELPISILHSKGENQFLFTSNVNNGKAYSNNSVDIFATKVDDGASFININDYYDDWKYYSGYEWNALVQVKAGSGKWITLEDQSDVYYDSSRPLGKTSDGAGSYAAKNIVTGDLTGYSMARVRVLVHIGPNLSVKNDDPVVEHKTVPDTPSVTGLTDGNKEDAKLQVRVNGETWLETSLDDVPVDENGIGWATVDLPVSILRSNAENQFLFTSNVKNGKTYSNNSVDIFATKVDEGASFVNVNDYYDDWSLYEGYEWNAILQVKTGSGEWTVLGNPSAVFYDSSRALGKATDGSGSYAAKNIVVEDLSGYSSARIQILVHIGPNLSVQKDDPFNPVIIHKLDPDTPSVTSLTDGSKDGAKLQVRVNGETWFETALDGVSVDKNGIGWVNIDLPVSVLRSNGENQFLFTSNVNNGKAYSNNSVDIFATKVDEGASFVNVNDYYDDWEFYEGYEWNALLQAKSENGEWITLGEPSAVYYDSSRILGKTSDGAGSYSAKNIVVGDLSGCSNARMQILVHIGANLNVNTSGDPVVVHVETAPKEGPSEHKGRGENGATLRIRVNGKWAEVSLKDYLGSTGWVSCPVDIGDLNANTENYFTAATNVKSYGTNCASSVDIFATYCGSEGAFITHDVYSDNDWTVLPDQYMNIRLELFDGEKWVKAPEGRGYYYDYFYNLGENSHGESMSAARNMILGDLSGYTRARVSVLMHVGTSLCLFSAPEGSSDKPVNIKHINELREEAPGADVADSENVKLRIRVNGIWFDAPLQEYKGKDGVWVPVYIDADSLRPNEENYFSVSTNAASYGEHSQSSVDLYYTYSASDLNSFYTDDEYCDTGYERYADRVINLRLEGLKGGEWVIIVPGTESYVDGCEILGFNAKTEEFQNYARNLILGGLSQYEGFRVSVQLHVGKTLALMDDYDSGSGEADFDRNRDVGRPDPAEVPDNPSDDPAANEPDEGSGTNVVLWVAVGSGAAVLTAAGIICVRLLGKRRKRIYR